MEVHEVSDIQLLNEYEIEQEDLKTMLDVMPMYGFVDNKGQLEDSNEYPFGEDGILDDDEKPDNVGREGESELRFAYDDFQYHLEGMIDGESFSNISDDEVLNLPEEDRKEAAGAVFGASYALFRNQVIEEGYPAEHAEFKQDIQSQEEKRRFLEEGSFEIQGAVIGPWGYDHERMNEVMDADVALKAYNDVAEELV
jgi:hypothetical protein